MSVLRAACLRACVRACLSVPLFSFVLSPREAGTNALSEHLPQLILKLCDIHVNDSCLRPREVLKSPINQKTGTPCSVLRRSPKKNSRG